MSNASALPLRAWVPTGRPTHPPRRPPSCALTLRRQSERRLWPLKAGPVDQGNPRLWRACRPRPGIWQIGTAYAASGGGACGETLTFLNGWRVRGIPRNSSLPPRACCVKKTLRVGSQEPFVYICLQAHRQSGGDIPPSTLSHTDPSTL